jgi:hypothetical protein
MGLRECACSISGFSHLRQAKKKIAKRRAILPRKGKGI